MEHQLAQMASLKEFLQSYENLETSIDFFKNNL